SGGRESTGGSSRSWPPRSPDLPPAQPHPSAWWWWQSSLTSHSMLEDVHVSGLGFHYLALEHRQIGQVQPADDDHADRNQDGGQGLWRRYEHEHHEEQPDQRADRNRYVETPEIERVLLASQPFPHPEIEHDDRPVEDRPDEPSHREHLQQCATGQRAHQDESHDDDQDGRRNRCPRMRVDPTYQLVRRKA